MRILSLSPRDTRPKEPATVRETHSVAKNKSASALKESGSSKNSQPKQSKLKLPDRKSTSRSSSSSPETYSRKKSLENQKDKPQKVGSKTKRVSNSSDIEENNGSSVLSAYSNASRLSSVKTGFQSKLSQLEHKTTATLNPKSSITSVRTSRSSTIHGTNSSGFSSTFKSNILANLKGESSISGSDISTSISSSSTGGEDNKKEAGNNKQNGNSDHDLIFRANPKENK